MQSDAANQTLPLFCENNAKLYFDAKHLEKGLNMGGENFGACFVQKGALFDQYWSLP